MGENVNYLRNVLYSNGCYGLKTQITLEMVSIAMVAMEQIPNNQSLATIAVVLLWKVS